jgi:hypothetical protein
MVSEMFSEDDYNRMRVINGGNNMYVECVDRLLALSPKVSFGLALKLVRKHHLVV